MISGISKSNYLIIAGFFISLAVFVYTGFKYIQLPLDRDEGTYLYMGYSFIHGYVPYVDFYEIKPPGIFLVYGLFHLLFGWTTETLHSGVFFIQLATACFIYKIIHQLAASSNTALTACAAYFLISVFPNFQGFAILSEHFFIFFIVLSLFFLTQSLLNRQIQNIFFAGLSLGFAAMIRQHAIFFILPFLYFLLVVSDKNKTSKLLPLLYFIGGNVLVIVSLIGYVFIRGGFEEMVTWVIENPSKNYISQVSWQEGKQYFYNYLNNHFLIRHWPVVLLFIIGLINLFINMISNSKKKEAILTLLFFISSMACIFPGFKFYGHYWLMMMPAFGMISGYACVSSRNKAMLMANSALILFMVSAQLYVNADLYFKIKGDEIYKRLYDSNPNYPLNKITGYLNKRLKKNEEIFVFGSEPQVYYQTSKISKTPHVYIGFVHTPGPASLQMQQEVIDFLENEKPEYLVHIQNPISINMKENSEQNLYNWIFSFENRYYTPVALAETDNELNTTYLYDKEAMKKPETTNYIVVYKLRK